MALESVEAFALTLADVDLILKASALTVARAFTDAAPSVANTSPTAYWYSQ
jgi:hypothetical protein